VILNLAVTFAVAALFRRVGSARPLGHSIPLPELASVDVFAALLALAGFVALWRYRVHVIWVIGGSALGGLLFRLVI
jgi:chromate transporter